MNVSITTSEDEFMNAGELSESSSSSSSTMLVKIMHESNILLMLHTLMLIGHHFL